jgi:hypothetical protein
MTPSTKKTDVFDAMARLQLEILKHKPTTQQMRKDIQMSSLSVRPQMGDIFTLNMANDQFIEALWSIITIDEFVSKNLSTISRKDHELFIRLTNHVRNSFQDALNRTDMRLPHVKERQSVSNQPIAIEIFRSRKSSRKVH